MSDYEKAGKTVRVTYCRCGSSPYLTPASPWHRIQGIAFIVAVAVLLLAPVWMPFLPR